MHMAKPNPLNRFPVIVTLALVFWILAGCGGGSGDTASTDDPPPPIPDEAPRVTITNVDISGGQPVAEFAVVDPNGFPVTGITQASFTIAKLVPGQDGDSARWQSYVNRVEQPGAGDWPGSEPQIQATAERDGVLLDNGDGTYRYTFATDLTAVTSPVAVTYQPELTHLVGMQLGGQAAGANAVYRFQPSTGNTRNISDLQIVSQESCGSCHGPSLDAHGGSRVDAEYCAACHNPGTADAQSGENLDFGVMVHKIHMGSSLPSGEPYVLWGFGNSRNDFSDVAHPQDVRNCVNCHDPDDGSTPQASRILTHPSAAACGSCHDDVNFETGENHIRGVDYPVTNDMCTACHSTGGIAGDPLESHAMPAKLASEQFQLNILDLELQGEQAVVTFSVTDPADGQTYQVPGPFRALSAQLNWTENGSPEYSALLGYSVNILTGNPEALGDGSYRARITIPQGSAPSNPGLFVVGLFGSAWLDGVPGSEVVRIASTTRFFAPDLEPDVIERRQVVSDALCSTCHERNEGPYSGHGENMTDHVQLCVICHKPQLGGLSGDRPLHSSSADMMFMIHAIHGSEIRGDDEYRDYGGLRYPRPASDCQACHLEQTFQLTSIPADKPAMVTRLDPLTLVSPQSAVCWSCHNSELAEIHMGAWGGQINVPAGELLDQELCFSCHGQGEFMDVGKVHGVP
jgi:OmcA/MtrC family decaheme c-type cytochrome